MTMAVLVWGFPCWDPGGEEFPGEIWDVCGGIGDFGHLCDGRFLIDGRPMVAENGAAEAFLDRLLGLLRSGLMFC